VSIGLAHLKKSAVMTDIKLCSGLGQFHSPNNQCNPRPYITTTQADIADMAVKPFRVAKEKAQWVILSTFLSRCHNEQSSHGQFYAIWADIDEARGLGFNDLSKRVAAIVPSFIAYTSRSATEENQKARIIVFLSEPVNGELFPILQKIFNDKIEAQGIKPDRVTERVGQICYLPNRGKFYDNHIENQCASFNISAWAEEIEQQQQCIIKAQAATRERLEQSRIKATQRMDSGCKSPIDAFNAAYDPANLLGRYGYSECRGRWLSPNSESGSAGVAIKDNRWISSHGSDVVAGIGVANDDSTGCSGDAFDLFQFYEHGNDRNAAIRAAGNMFVVDGVTRQIEAAVTPMDEQPKLEPLQEDPLPLPEELTPVEPFDYDLLPSSLVPWVKDICDRLQCPPDFVAVAVMAALGSLIGRTVGIRPQ
jgi:hypothetical protein